jgi:ribulose 1,5-bisphosphate synthetase/thiazole synthase
VLFSLSSSSPLEDNVENADIVICGGGPTGLLSAIMLSQKFPNVST